MVARWRYGAFRVVGLEFLRGGTQIDPTNLAPHLAQLKHLQYIKLPDATATETARWRDRLPEQYAVVHCEGE